MRTCRAPDPTQPTPAVAVAAASSIPGAPGAQAAAAPAAAAVLGSGTSTGLPPAVAAPLAAGAAAAGAAAAGAAAGSAGAGAVGSGVGGGAKLEASLLANLKKKIQEKAAAPEKLKTTGVAFQAVEEVCAGWI